MKERAKEILAIYYNVLVHISACACDADGLRWLDPATHPTARRRRRSISLIRSISMVVVEEAFYVKRFFVPFLLLIRFFSIVIYIYVYHKQTYQDTISENWSVRRHCLLFRLVTCVRYVAIVSFVSRIALLLPFRDKYTLEIYPQSQNKRQFSSLFLSICFVLREFNKTNRLFRLEFDNDFRKEFLSIWSVGR